MDDILSSAIKANFDGASSDSIIVAPQFFSEKYNSGVSAAAGRLTLPSPLTLVSSR